MRTSSKVLFFVVASSLAGHSVAAQAPLSGDALQLTPYAGYLVTGDILKGPLGTSLSTASGPVYGAQLGMKMAPNISLIGNIAYATSNIRVGLPIIGGYNVGTSSMLMFDGGLELQLPVAGATSMGFAPFLQIGAGAIQYKAEASILNTQATNFAANAGAGADLTLSPNIGLRLMVKDYIGKFDFQEATSFDVKGETAHNWAFSAGLRLSF